ncbi:Transcriptional regulatory protein SrrA [bioreactor metagenome]|uniref:Transcriptional regulatory protein SrrA n=1 Tax=bioreactor metagenome TaxID=1076179 RepID=A0A644ZN37_9ZZZZ
MAPRVPITDCRHAPLQRSAMKPNSSPATAPLILVVEDEPGIATILRAYLERDGLRVQLAQDGAEAVQAFRRMHPDLVLLDVHLPAMDGIDVLRAIRDHGQTPVIMVTALADDVDKLVALRLGADDYVVKPFNPAEVVARVRAVLRRTQQPQQAKAAPIRVGALEINDEEHSATVHDDRGRARPLPLTLTEFRLLTLLAAQPRRCFSRAHLIEHCLPESDALERVIDSHLSKLRRKLQLAGQEHLIETVRGIGYRLWPED